MVDVYSYVASLKLNWLKRLCDNSQLMEFVVNMYPGMKNVECLGAKYIQTLLFTVDNPFWIDVLKHLQELSAKCVPQNVHEFMSECIHHNNHILRDKQPFCIKQLCECDIYYVR